MRKAHLAILPTPEGRRAERRIVNLAASLREPGASLVDAEVVNLSITGFAVETDGEAALEPGGHVWLKLPGLEPTNSRVVWVEGTKAGFEFVTPLHPATLDLVTNNARRPPVKRHFGLGGTQSGGLRAR